MGKAKKSLSAFGGYLHVVAPHKEHVRDLAYYKKHHPDLNISVKSAPIALCVVDYTMGGYPFFIQNIPEVGFRGEAFGEGGLDFLLEHYHPEDLKFFSKYCFPKNLEVIMKAAPEEREKYRFTHNFRMLSKKKQWVMLRQQYSFIEFSEQGMPLLSLCVGSDISFFCDPHKVINVIEKLNEDYSYELICRNVYYTNPEAQKLSRREKEILNWVVEGLSSQQIARKLNLSLHTVNTHRKNMLQKTGAKNVAELIRYAVLNKII